MVEPTDSGGPWRRWLVMRWRLLFRWSHPKRSRWSLESTAIVGGAGQTGSRTVDPVCRCVCDTWLRHWTVYIFHTSDKDWCCISIVEIHEGNTVGFQPGGEKTLKAMLDAKVIKPSQTEWASPPVLVRKRDGTWHYCIDFRGVNALTTCNAYLLPFIEECIDSLADMRWFSTLDMNSGYWQLPVAKEDKEKIVFITKYGLFHFFKCHLACQIHPLHSSGPWTWYCPVLSGWVL